MALSLYLCEINSPHCLLDANFQVGDTYVRVDVAMVVCKYQHLYDTFLCLEARILSFFFSGGPSLNYM